MDSIDPKLRGSASAHSYEAQRPPSHPYPDVNTATAGYEPLQPASTPTHQNSQQHQYYGMPAPSPYPAQSHESPYDTSPMQTDPSDPNDLKRLRACEACRQLKVRCEPEDTGTSGSCKRCAKANRQCVVTVPSRKRQKKTDSRVAELEKKIDALTASLVARGGDEDSSIDPAIAQAQMAELQQHRQQLYGDHHTQDPGASMSTPSVQMVSPPVPKGVKRKMSSSFGSSLPQDSVAAASPAFMPHPPSFHGVFRGQSQGAKEWGGAAYIDVVDRKILDVQTAYRCFDRYTAEMVNQLPIVVFPPGTKAEDIRRTKPLLFLTVLAVASGAVRPDVQSALLNEATRIFAERIVCRGEKSFELVQTVQLMAIFYQPPEKYEELNFVQLIHMAAVMALDLGMGKRAKPGSYAIWKEFMEKKSSLPDPNAAETRRTWLGCYFLCTNSSMSLRRPLLVRWSAYNDECLDILATAADALPSDKWLCHLVRAQHIAEDVGFQFSMDDPASTIFLTEQKTQYHLKAFERRLAEWRAVPTKKMHKALAQHSEAIIDLYMHEIAMHHNHNIDDFKPPYNITPQEHSTPDPDLVTPAHIDSLTVCLSSIHSAFEAFLSMDIVSLRAMPTLFFVRNSYAAVALIKLYTAVTSKGSKFASIFKVSELRVEYYFDALIGTLLKAAEGNKCRVAQKFSFIFNMLRGWHTKRADAVQTSRNGGSQIKHLGDPFHPASPLQDSNTTPSWSSHQIAGGNIKAQHSGLQMLSDAAMVKNEFKGQQPDHSTATAAGLAAQTGQDAWGYTPGYSTAPSVGSMMNYGFAGGELDPLGFTPEELHAMGTLIEDPTWMSFGLEQAGYF